MTPPVIYLSSLNAPHQVGRLFEVKGESSVRTVLMGCGDGEREETAVQLAELRGGPDAVH